MEKARSRLTQLFKFLQALDQLKNPVVREVNEQPWLLALNDIPDHATIVLREYDSSSDDLDDTDSTAPANSSIRTPILTVKQPTLADCPAPPAELIPWLAAGWDVPDRPLELLEVPAPVASPGSAELIQEIPQLFADFAEKRKVWATKEIPTRRAMALFERLYALQASIERESERVELILSDGFLRWKRTDGQSIEHPILLQRIQLGFNPQVPEFQITEADSPPELYTAVFRSIPEVSANALASTRADLERGSFHPLGGDETTSFLKRFVTQLSPRGKLTELRTPALTIDEPVIGRDPLIFLRRRTLGFGKAIESILEDLKDRKDIPSALTTVLGIESLGMLLPEEKPEENTIHEQVGDEDILLTKPANSEQLAVARSLERHGLVLVQGPPGTGKTHTIGNLIGHLLAQGKSILVTSHTAKALRVLREKIVEGLRPLCVSQLDDGSTQMADAIDSITDRLSRSDAHVLGREAEQAASQRSELIRQIRETRRDLVEGLQDEYRQIIVAGKEYSPSSAARFLNEHRETASWLPGPVSASAPLPLSHSELVELYATNGSTAPTDEQELGPALPDLQKLIPTALFAELVKERFSLAAMDLTIGSSFWKEGTGRQAESLRSMLERAQAVVESIGTAPAWQLAAIDAGQQKGPRREAWEDLLQLIDSVREQADRAHKYSVSASLALPPDIPLDQVIKVLDEITAHLSSSKKIGAIQLLLKPEWKSLIKASQVNGRSPSERMHFSALRALAGLQQARERLVGRWQRQVSELGGPSVSSLGSEPERSCEQFAPVIRKRLVWHELWPELQEELEENGFSFDLLLEDTAEDLTPYGNLKRIYSCVVNQLPEFVKAEAGRLRVKEIDDAFYQQGLYLHTKVIGEGNKAIASALLSATRTLDEAAYEEAFRRAAELVNRSSLVARRGELIRKLDAAAPGWAAAILLRDGIHGSATMPDDAENAWLWRQFEEELSRRSRTNITELQDRLTALTASLQELTATLVDKKAWASQLSRTSLPQRQAIQGWKVFMQKLPKGQGKRRTRLLSEARKLMPTCQTAIPVWIMPLSRVVENMDPKKNRFDVVVVDEASQADVMALTALYLGREIMIVGDHEQVTPSAVGQRQEDVVKLIDEHLTGIPNAKLYDGQTSIYDLAKTAFPGMISLREHFRCVEPIIQFSNHLSYNGKIEPLRDESSVRIRPPCIAFRVEAAPSEGKVNEEEAIAVASLVVACTEQSEYSKPKLATFGVISMVGDEQALRIDQLLQRHLPPMEYKNRKLQCGNSAQFQGDERDVMFLSMVDTSPTSPPLTLRSEGFLGLYKKRFNVAASRAGDQMWVIHSLNPARDLQVEDLRYKLIKHAENPFSLIEEIDRKAARTESEFERQIITRLIEAGFEVTPQWKVGAYRIDMVVGNRDNRIAIECDGDKVAPAGKDRRRYGKAKPSRATWLAEVHPNPGLRVLPRPRRSDASSHRPA